MINNKNVWGGKMLNIKILKALNGDCIIISYGEEEKHNILIDGGQGRVYFIL